jgi:hypothetical protein
MVEALKVISSGKRKVNGKLFLFPDHQSGRMRFFDVWGELIETRPLTIDEKQTKLFLGEDGINKHQTSNEEAGVVDVEHVEINDATETQALEENTEQQPVKPRKASRKKNQDKAQAGEDINEKVAAMTKGQKGRKAAFQTAVEKQAAPQAEGSDHAEGFTEGPQAMEIHIEEAEIEQTQGQIPREETKIDPSQVPPLDEGDELPE